MNEDIEKVMKRRLSECADGDMVATGTEVGLLMDRLAEYRKRLSQRAHRFDVQMAPLQRELADHRRTLAWARKRLDPESKGNHYSCLDSYEGTELLREIEKRRGHVIAMRLFYGKPMSPEIAEETLGVLKAAIEEAQREKDRWFKYLADARKKECEKRV